MSILDFHQASPDKVFEADICIIGTGPAGIAIAAQFVGLSTRILLVESGGFDRLASHEALNRIESVGHNRSPHELTRTRGFGGTSALWTGRCGVFDDIDYEQRPWLEVSGWPISHATLTPYFDRAGVVLGLGPSLYSRQLWQLLRNSSDSPSWDASTLLPVVWQFSRGNDENIEPVPPAVAKATKRTDAVAVLQHSGAPEAKHLGQSYRPVFQTSENIDLLVHATAISINASAAGDYVNSISVKSLDGKAGSITAKRVVLACGGIDNARLLLASTSVKSCGVGNDRGMVGRYLTDHTFAEIGTYFRKGSERFRTRLGNRWLDFCGKRHVYQIGLRMAPELQRREGLLNCSLHLLERDPQKHAISLFGDLLREAKKGKIGSKELQKLLRAAAQPKDFAKGVHDRFVRKRPSLRPSSAVAFGCIVEQKLDPESRITLSKERDALGVPLAKINWKISDLEYTTALRMSDVVFAEMKRLGYELPIRADWCDDGADSLRERLIDLAHPMCATRMSEGPEAGVVDADCKVHGVDNLYIAGSSVFSTPGYMNPTLMIAALSVRLADHLKSELRNHDRAAGYPMKQTPPHVSSSEPRHVRIGIVGAGDRIRKVYIPSLAALADQCQIVGVVSRSSTSTDSLASSVGCPGFSTIADLVSKARPDFLVSAVSTHSVDAMLAQLVATNLPVLVETPFAWNVRHGRKMLQRIGDRQNVGVAEQTPFLPLEQLKRQLIDLGLFGRISAAENGFAAYDYHGIAAIRAYLDGSTTPVRVNAIQSRFPAILGAGTQSRDEIWTLATVTFEDGTTLVHHYSDAYFDSPMRGPKSLRLYGSRGSMEGSIVKGLTPGGEFFEATVQRHMNRDHLLSLSLDTPIGIYSWDNPFAQYPLSDEQIAVTTLLHNMMTAVLQGGAPIYPASRAQEDMEILAAIRYSCEADGAPVRLPLKPIVRQVVQGPKRVATKVLRQLKVGAS